MVKIYGRKRLNLAYFDVENEPEKIELKPKVHHFRSSNINLVATELEKHWISIVENNICIPTHEIMIVNESEKVLYRTTKFLSDKIEIENSASDEILHYQVDAIGEFVQDVIDFALNKIEEVNAMEETTDEPDFTLNETMNTEIPDLSTHTHTCARAL